MKELFDKLIAQAGTLLRHSLTGLAGLGGLLLSKGWIDPAYVESLNQAGASLIDIIVVTVSAILGRVVILLLEKFGSKPITKVSMLFFFCALTGLCLPSCAELEKARVGLELVGDRYSASYSSKSGLNISARLPSPSVDRGGGK